MRSFFKMFFATFLALIIFCMIAFFIMAALAATLTTRDKPRVAAKTVILLDLGKHFPEKKQEMPLARLIDRDQAPGLYDVVRLIRHARDNDRVAGIYIKADANSNGFASSTELRHALQEFREAKKFVIAYGDVMTERAYYVSSVADKIYVNPTGLFEWKGMNVTLPFIKGTLEKLDIKPQIFYAGKYKSATEIFRTDKMTPENREQTREWLHDIYSQQLLDISGARGVDTATLHSLANNAAITTPADAVNYRLIDGAKYDDQVKDELKELLGIGKFEKLQLMSMEKYNESVTLPRSGRDRIAIIFAQGNIVDGDGDMDNIGGDRFRQMIRKARLDKSVKAIVLRVNSGGGSALASENIWRELQMARQDNKPVVVSMGDVAASGGYYIACGADSIFAQANTITGSIGVFGIIPDMGGFFKNKLGVTFDGVKTAEYADLLNVYRPMNERERQIVQNMVDRVYSDFKQRVASGRNRDTAYIDSIAQGRVWSGTDAQRIGLVDRIGSLQDAVECAARMAKLESYGVREYPESQNWIENLLGRKKEAPQALIRQELGEENYRIYLQLVRIRELTGSVQARLPYDIILE